MLKKILKSLIKTALWILDPDHRKKELIADDNTKKFTHSQDVSFQSDFGQVSKVFRTVPYNVWQLKTDNHELLAADKHLVVRENGECVWMEDLKIGDKIRTDSGIESVLFIEDLNIRTHMYDVQVDTDDHLYYSNGILSHNTTCAVAYLLWKAMFTDDMTILIVANNQQQALEIMGRVRYMYESLNENWLRAGVVKYNEGTIEFDNRSKIVSRATSPYATRGLSVSLVYIDEFSFVMPHVAAEFWASILPTLATGGNCIITSTPNNDEDQFANLWFGANTFTDEQGNDIDPTGPGRNGFFPVKVTWDKHPDRDQKWADKFRQQLGEEKFKREFEGEFISRDETLINSMTLRNLVPSKPLLIDSDGVRWYNPIRANRTYFVGLDPSMGHGGDADDATSGGDNSGISVYELPSMEQVAEWRSRDTLARDQVKILIRILIKIYQDLDDSPDQEEEPEIFWSFENNAMGHTIEEIIQQTGEDNFPGTLVNEPNKPGIARRRRGLNTNQRTKLQACSQLKTYLESQRLTIKSAALISELKNYVVAAGSYKARWGSSDDLIAASMICLRSMQIVSRWDENVMNSVNSAVDLDEIGIREEQEPMPVMIL